MHDSTQPHHIEPSDPPNTEAERLMTRLIDGECAAADRARFEQLAANDPSLWRELALRQIDAAQLCAEAGPIIDRLAETPLLDSESPAAEMMQAHADRSGDAPLLRIAAWTGWAAVLLLVAVWTALAISRPVSDTGARPANETPGMTPPASDAATAAELWDDYLATPHVQGELEPILLESIERPDGQVELRYLRRVEEVQTFGSVDEVPRNERGRRLRLAPPDTSRPDDSPAVEPVRP